MNWKLLVIAAEQTGINASAEFSSISRLVRIQILSGVLSYDAIYRVCLTDGPFDGIHFVGHNFVVDDAPGASDRLMLSANWYMEQQQVASLVLAARSDMVFLSACDTATVGTYIALNSRVQAVIYTTKKIVDGTAWEFPERFYRSLADQFDLTGPLNYLSAYKDAVSPARDGVYSYISTVGLSLEQEKILTELRSIKALLAVTRSDLQSEIGEGQSVARKKATAPVWLSFAIYISILCSFLLLALGFLKGLGM